MVTNRHGHLLRRTISVETFRWLPELDDRYVRSVLDKSGTSQVQCNGDSSSNKNARGKPETILSAREHHDHRSMAGLCEYMSEVRCDNSVADKEVMREASRPTLGSSQTVNSKRLRSQKDARSAHSSSDGAKEERTCWMLFCTVTGNDCQSRGVQLPGGTEDRSIPIRTLERNTAAITKRQRGRNLREEPTQRAHR